MHYIKAKFIEMKQLFTEGNNNKEKNQIDVHNLFLKGNEEK